MSASTRRSLRPALIRCVRSGGAAIGGAISFPGAREQSKLTDEQNLALNVLDRTIHYAIFIIKKAQSNELAAQPFDVRGSVSGFDGQ